MSKAKTAMGRPPKGKFERQRTRLWSEAVLVASGKREFKALETVLGEDGKWEGVWSRYCRGAVSPGTDRVHRIEHVLPGTAKYFYAPFWTLAETRCYTRVELDQCWARCAGRLREMWQVPPAGVFGRFQRSEAEARECLIDTTALIRHPEYGVDSVNAILIAIRDAELRQDGAAYLQACKAWAVIEVERSFHPVLRYLSPRVLDDVTAPMRKMKFIPDSIDALWQSHVQEYCERRGADATTYEVLDCLYQLDV